MKKALALLVLVACAFPVTALAQDPPANARRDSVDPVTTYEFVEGSDVSGGRYNPEGVGISVRRRSRRFSLVQPRPHYVPELLKSVENM
jgi:hypothetical protein